MAFKEHQEVLERIRGQTVQLSDFRPLFTDASNNINPHYLAMIPIANGKLEELVKEPKKLAKMKAADLALIASCWYPQAPCAELRILTLLSIWLFLWDDEIDESTGKHIDNFESAQTYRKETLDFTQHSLGLGTLAGVSEISNPIIISFLEIGQHLAKAYSIEQCEMFFGEIKICMDASQREQEIRLSGKLPTVEMFQKYRMGTSGVALVLGAIEYAYQLKFSYASTKDPNLKKVWDETTIIVSIANDILSLKKEIADGWVSSLVPILFVECGDLQSAINKAYNSMLDAIRRFETAAADFISKPSFPSMSSSEAQALIQGCRDIWVGNLAWSFRTRRYRLGPVDELTGTVSMSF